MLLPLSLRYGFCSSGPDRRRLDPFFQDEVREVTAMTNEMRKAGVEVVGDMP